MPDTTHGDKALETRLIVAIANCALPESDPTEPGAAWDRGFNAGLRLAIQAVRGELEVAAYAKALGVERAPLGPRHLGPHEACTLSGEHYHVEERPAALDEHVEMWRHGPPVPADIRAARAADFADAAYAGHPSIDADWGRS